MTPSLYKSFIYANILGTYFILLAVLFLSRRQYYIGLLQAAKPSVFSFFVTGLVFLFLGIYFIHLHNVWVIKPRLLLTVLAWMVFIKGLILLVFPEWSLQKYKDWIRGPYIYLSILLMLLIGLGMVLDGARLIFKLQKAQENIFKRKI